MARPTALIRGRNGRKTPAVLCVSLKLSLAACAPYGFPD